MLRSYLIKLFALSIRWQKQKPFGPWSHSAANSYFRMQQPQIYSQHLGCAPKWERERKALPTLPLFWARWGFIFQNGYDKCPNIGTNTNTQADDRGQSEPWDLQRFDPSHSSRACVSVQISFRNKHHYYSGVE